MALIKFGSVVTDGRGKIGGHMVQKSNGGLQLKNKPVHLKRPSAKQMLIRSINLRLQQTWRTLSQSEQNTWSDWAVSHSVCNHKGDKRFLSGHQLYLKYNFIYAYYEIPLLVDPAKYLPEPLGPELIVNGIFDGRPPWGFAGSVLFPGGYADVPGPNYGMVHQPVNSFINLKYRFSCSILFRHTPVGFLLRDFSNVNIFTESPFSYYPINPGTYTFVGTRKASSDGFRLYIESGQVRTGVTSVSFRQIL